MFSSCSPPSGTRGCQASGKRICCSRWSGYIEYGGSRKTSQECKTTLISNHLDISPLYRVRHVLSHEVDLGAGHGVGITDSFWVGFGTELKVTRVMECCKWKVLLITWLVKVELNIFLLVSLLQGPPTSLCSLTTLKNFHLPCTALNSLIFSLG